MKASDVIELAKNDPRYLNGVGGSYWLCSVVNYLWDEQVIDREAFLATKDAIYESLNHEVFLASKLRDEGIISTKCCISSQEYATAAHEHWNTTIADLRAKGQ